MSEALVPPTEGHIIDTNLFIVFERNDALELLERVVTERGVEFLIPERVYDELTSAGTGIWSHYDPSYDRRELPKWFHTE